MGHINYRKLGEAHKTMDGIGKVTAPNVVCEVCAEAKATRKPVNKLEPGKTNRAIGHMQT